MRGSVSSAAVAAAAGAPAGTKEAAPKTGTEESKPDWRSAFRSALLSRKAERRKAALEKLLPVYEEASAEILAEVALHGKALAAKPWWGRLRLRPFLGYRSACASLHRTMVNHVLPEQADSRVRVQKRSENGTQRVRYVLRDDPMEGDAEDERSGKSEDRAEEPDEAAADSTRQARALVVLLRQLGAATPWELEAGAVAAKRQEESDSFDQWLGRTPKLETPQYEVIFREPQGAFEVRKYAPYSVVQTGGGSSMSTAGNTSSFFKLAGYIFGKSNVDQEKMAMTTPVQTERRTGAMSFIMPSKYWGEDGLQSAPAPAEDAGVRLESRPAELVAVSTFGGYARGRAVLERTEALLAALEQQNNLNVPDKENTRLMQYNDPFTVPWKRRNEVSVPVELN